MRRFKPLGLWNVTFIGLCDLAHLAFKIRIFSKKEVSPAWARAATLEEDGFSYESSISLLKEED